MGPKAPKGQTLAQADQRALRGDVESQDSQLFLEQYHQRYAPGLRSSSPNEPPPPDVIHAQLQQYPRPAKIHQRFAGATAPASNSNPRLGPKEKAKANPRGRSTKDNPAKDKGQGQQHQQHTAGASAGAAESSGVARTKPAPDAFASHDHRASPIQTTRHPSGRATLSQTVKQTGAEVEPVPAIGPRFIDDNESNPHNDSRATLGAANPSRLNQTLTDDDGGNDHNARLPGQVSARSTTRKKPKTGLSKMEKSQSPTQSNDGRSYEQYLPRGDDLAATDSLQESEPVPQPSEHLPNFDDETESLHDDDTGAVNFENIDRYDTDLTALDPTSTGKPAHGSPGQFSGDPETPAPHKNPFAGSKAHLLNGSQLFKQTQVSSACKAFSPTSSRPSPDNFRVQDSISPNVIISSPLKNRVGLSPLQGAPSSSQFLPQIHTSPQQAQDEQVAPDDADAASSTPYHPIRRLPTGLMEFYQPVHKSHDRRRPSLQAGSDTASDEEASYNDEVRRSHRAMLKRMAAEKQLRSISYERSPASEDIIVPSTNTRKEKTHRIDSPRYLDQCEGKAGEDSQGAVENSQDVIVQPEPLDAQQAVIDDSQAGNLLPTQEHVEETSSNVAVVLDTLPNTLATSTLSSHAAEAEDAANAPDGSHRPIRGDADAIPETSPAKLRPLGEMLLSSSDEVSKPESFTKWLGSSFQGSSQDRSESGSNPHLPGVRSSAFPQGEMPARRSPRIFAHSPGLQESHNTSGDNLQDSSARSEAAEAIATSQVISSSPPMPAARTRARLRGKRGHVLSTSSEGPGSSGSSLSVLTTTPTFSNNTTPLTDESPANAGNLTPSSSNEPHTSPAAAKANRRGSSGAVPGTKPGMAPQKNLRSSIRRSRASITRQASVSTDELARSPSSSRPRAFEQSVMIPRLGRSSLRETPGSRETSRGDSTRILTGMAFAISFQARQPNEKDSHYNSRLGLSVKIADQVKQAGGKVLGGFDDLFELSAIKKAEVASSTPPPDEEIQLTAAAKNIGFTALIADGHSRKVKYMQALALGIPCIHERWITTCVEKQRLVDWSDYLLCAGNSSFLGNAIRSRNLPFYDVASAKLSEIIQSRPQLLHGSRILLVLRKQDEDMKMAYVFLARVLGASLSRVYSMDEAKRQLKASEDAGHPYDWVYVEDKLAARVDFLSGGGPTASSSKTLAAGSKKRKRKSEADLADSPPKKIRVLSDELVIQSLILGRLLEDGEMNG